MKKSILKSIKIVLPIALAVLFLYLAYSQFSPQQLETIKTQIATANYYWVALGLTFAFLSHLSRAWRWRYMLEAIHFKTPFLTNIVAIGIGYALNMFIPRSGELARAVTVNKASQVPVDQAIGTIIAERVLDLVMLFIITTAAVLLSGEVLIDFLWDGWDSAFAKANSQKTLFILLAVVIVIIAGVLVALRLRLMDKLKGFILGIKQGFSTIITMEKKGLYLLHTVFIWVMYVMMFYVTIFSLEETAALSWAAVLSAFVAGSLAVAFTNGGFAAYPYLIAQVLLLYGLDEVTGTSLGWILWLSQSALVIIYGLISLLLLTLLKKR